MNLRAHFVGATRLIVGTNTVVTVTPPGYLNGWHIEPISGGSLFLVNADGVSHTLGIPIEYSRGLSIDGPAKFFLNSAGATTIVGLFMSKSDGSGD